MLVDGEPKSCKPNPIKNEKDSMKEIYEFVTFWEGLWEEDNTIVLCGQYGWLIPYWESMVVLIW